MATATPAFRRSKGHIIYKLQDGTRVPGTTTITSLLDRPQLVAWANRLGLEGIDSASYRDSMAGIGTLVHAMALSDLSGQPLAEDLQEYSPKEVGLAENAMIKFLDWRKAHDVKPVLLEAPLVSEKYRYGGTLDFYGEIDGKLSLADLKSGKAVYPEMVYQLAAYRQLLVEHGHPVENVRIVRIGRDESEGFEERIFGNLDAAWEVFAHLRAIYDLKKQLGG